MINKPNRELYPAYFAAYVDLIPDGNVLDFLEDQEKRFADFLDNRLAPKAAYAYEEGKWTGKEVLGHLLDSERVFAHRALFLARGDAQSLPGFEQDDYVRSGMFNQRTFQSLTAEFRDIRRSTLALLKNLPKESYDNVGQINGYKTAFAVLPYLIAGHVEYHIKILEDKYEV